MEAELLFDLTNPSDRYAKIPGHPGIVRLVVDSGATDKVTELPPIRGREMGRPAG